MQCVDCHFSQDAHGNGHIYGEVAAAIEIDCADCHGTVNELPDAVHQPARRRSPAARDLSLLRTQDGRKRFEWRDGKLYQRAALDPDKEWEMYAGQGHRQSAASEVQRQGGARQADVGRRFDAVGPGRRPGQARARQRQGGVPDLPHCRGRRAAPAATCRSRPTAKTERHHYEGGETRNFATYNPQVARDDMFQLGRHGPVKGGKIAPVRSSSALVLSSTNINRERIYIQQPPIAASGFRSQAFAPHYPHTERKTETKTCTDCHVSAANDNNAIMAQLLLQGTNFVNFVGYNAWVGEEKRVSAVQVTEWDEPQAVIGSYLQRYAYPDWYAAAPEARPAAADDRHARHQAARRAACSCAASTCTSPKARAACASTTSPASPTRACRRRSSPRRSRRSGHDTHIASTNATCVALPTNQPINPLRNEGELMRVTNQEQPFHPIYSYAAITDAVEGLILTDVDDDGRRRSAEQFPDARGDVESTEAAC